MTGRRGRRRFATKGQADVEHDIVGEISAFLIDSGFVRVDLPAKPGAAPPAGPFRGVFWRHAAGVGGRTVWQGRSVPDLVGVLAPHGRAFALEVKRPGARAQDHELRQVAIETLLLSAGAVASRVRSVADVADLLGLRFRTDEADLAAVVRRLADLPVWAGLKLRGRLLIEYSSPELIVIRDEMRAIARRDGRESIDSSS